MSVSKGLSLSSGAGAIGCFVHLVPIRTPTDRPLSVLAQEISRVWADALTTADRPRVRDRQALDAELAFEPAGETRPEASGRARRGL